MRAEDAALFEGNDPIRDYLLRGEAQTLHAAEEQYLNDSLPEILDLLRGPLGDAELSRHPLFQLFFAHTIRTQSL